MTNKEFRERLSGRRLRKEGAEVIKHIELEESEVPESIDWRELGAVSAVQD